MPWLSPNLPKPFASQGTDRVVETLPATGKVLVLLILLFGITALPGCSGKSSAGMAAPAVPQFVDDLDRDSLKKSLRVSLDYLAGRNPEQTFALAGQAISCARITRSLQLFLEILDTVPDDTELNARIKADFEIIPAAGAGGSIPERRLLVTGYFQPVFEGSLTREGPFSHPLYSVPGDLVRQLDKNGEIIFGRREKDRLVPYWSRAEIETADKAAGLELVWLKDPFEVFTLHVQGSGLIRLGDGTLRGVHYAAKNGRPYRSIGRYLVETGRMTLEQTTMESIGAYLADHPAERDEILHHNHSFIFFAFTDTHGARGNLGRELTAGRSIAVDQSLFPPGGLGFLISRKPAVSKNGEPGWAPLHRFVTIQDSGSAIKGPGRVDLFWGTGPLAGREAGMMKEKGQLYLFLAREDGT
jgi:membrane-bound lytic murein transglycosylase A